MACKTNRLKEHSISKIADWTPLILEVAVVTSKRKQRVIAAHVHLVKVNYVRIAEFGNEPVGIKTKTECLGTVKFQEIKFSNIANWVSLS